MAMQEALAQPDVRVAPAYNKGMTTSTNATSTDVDSTNGTSTAAADAPGTLLPRPFVFVRHGETFYNRARLIAGRMDVVLTPLGERQALEACALLGGQRWSRVAVSTMFRARKTARLIVPNALLHFDHGLRERDWGALEGLAQRHPMPYFDTPAGGESWAIFRTRVLASLNATLDAFDCPLIVAHSGVFRVIREAVTGTPHGPRIGNVEPVVCLPGAEGGFELLSCFEAPGALERLSSHLAKP